MKRAHTPSIYPDLSPAQREALLPGAHWQDDLTARPDDTLLVGPAVAKEAKKVEAACVAVWPDGYDLARRRVGPKRRDPVAVLKERWAEFIVLPDEATANERWLAIVREVHEAYYSNTVTR